MTTETMTRAEMAAELRRLAAKGCDLRNGCVLDTLDTTTPPQGLMHGVSPSAAEAWSTMCAGITLVSVWPTGPEGGCVRYDEPGRMDPVQRAPVLFAPAEYARGNTTFLRRHCDRLIAVRD